MTAVRTRILDGFDDLTFGPDQWEELLSRGNQDIIYLAWHWQRAWWETFGSGELLLIVAERDGEVVALAPLYADSGMVYFIGSSFEFDRLDFIGDISDPEVLDAILWTARHHVPDFEGFQFYFVPDRSGTGKRLEAAADRLGFSCYEEWELPTLTLDLAGRREVALAAVNKKKKSLLQHERFFRREGALEVRHLEDGEAILPHLEEFFGQHIARWALTPNPSRFLKASQRQFYESLTRVAADTGWLRFTRLDWQGRPIAFHYGFCYHGCYFWDSPSFAIDLARRSPGQVLLRQLLLAAIDEGVRAFDFGTVDFAFKLRFATDINYVRGWGLYPSRGQNASDEGQRTSVGST